MADVFPPQHIISLTTATTPHQVVSLMVQRLVLRGLITEELREELVDGVMRREEYGSSAIGNRLAFPHLRTSLVSTILGCFAFLQKGCDFAALDGKPTQCIWLTLAPPSQRQEHMAVLNHLFRLVRDPTIQLRMEHPDAANQIWHYVTNMR